MHRLRGPSEPPNAPEARFGARARRFLRELVSDGLAGAQALELPSPPDWTAYIPDPRPPVPPAMPARPAVGFGGGGAINQATSPESTATFAPGSTQVRALSPPAAVIGAGQHSRVLIRNTGPGVAYLGDSNVTVQTGELVRPGDTVLYASSAGVWAIAAPQQPATLTWRQET